MELRRDDLAVGRVLNEDDDFLTLEVAKHDAVKFTLQQNEDGETVGGDRFLTLLFIRSESEDGRAEIWKPWEDG